MPIVSINSTISADVKGVDGVPNTAIKSINAATFPTPISPFVMEIDSTNLTSQTMTLGLTSTGSYDFDVDWGDGSAVSTITAYNSPDATHTYAASQTYTITLTPNTLTGLREYVFGNLYSTNNEHLAYITISSWGVLYLHLNKQSLFKGCTNLNWDTAVAGIPNFSSKVMGNEVFRDCDSLTADLSGWGTASSPITGQFNLGYFSSKAPTTPNFNWVANWSGNLSSGFSSSDYNAPLNNWNTSGSSNIGSCFNNNNVFNQNINSWDVSGMTDMRNIFQNAHAFNQPLDTWDVSSATRLDNIFSNARAFNQDINSWNVSSVTNFQNMFLNAFAFNQDLNSWNTISATTMALMFNGATVFNGNISSWNVSNVTTFFQMFRSASAFNGNVESWNVSSCSIFRGMFREASAFQGVLSSWNVSNGTNMAEMFNGTSVVNPNLDLSSWDVRNVSNFNRMFYTAQVAFDLSGWQVYSATNLAQFAQIFSGTNFSDKQCQDAFVAWAADALTARNVNATNIWGSRTYIKGGAMEQANNTLTSAPYSWTVTGLTFDGLLNTYTGAASAYSLRQLSNSTTNVIQVRRDSDDATQDIGLVNGELDTASIASFCGSARGYVTLWVDQSGNANDARQTAFTAQPMIYNGTAVVLENGKPALDFNSGRFMSISNPPISNLSSTAVSIFNVIAPPDTTTDGVAYTLTDTAAIDNVISFSLNRVTGQYSANRFINASTSLTVTRSGDTHGVNQSLFTFESTGATNVTAYEDSVQATQTPTTSRGNFINVIGSNSASGTNPFNGTMQEWIIYPSNPNRKFVEDNINEYYSIY